MIVSSVSTLLDSISIFETTSEVIFSSVWLCFSLSESSEGSVSCSTFTVIKLSWVDSNSFSATVPVVVCSSVMMSSRTTSFNGVSKRFDSQLMVLSICAFSSPVFMDSSASIVSMVSVSEWFCSLSLESSVGVCLSSVSSTGEILDSSLDLDSFSVVMSATAFSSKQFSSKSATSFKSNCLVSDADRFSLALTESSADAFSAVTCSICELLTQWLSSVSSSAFMV